jgi:hypothetical protein
MPSRFCPPRIFGVTIVAAVGFFISPAYAQVQCTFSGNDKNCVNSGTIGDGALIQTVVIGTGNASFTNSGTIGANANIGTGTIGSGSGTMTNSGVVGANANIQIFGDGIGNASLINSGSIGPNASIQIVEFGTGRAALINSGVISGSVQLVSGSTSQITSLAGSRIIGSIFMGIGPGPGSALEFIGGNYLYNINVAYNQINIITHGAPFAISGASIAVLDPTVLALEDRSVMNFTNGISSMLQDRFGGMGIPGGSAGAAMPMNFAPDFSDRLSAAHDAFAGLPSLSMSYSSDDSKTRNATAMYTKAPIAAAVPVNDITVWTSGFGGERRQQAYEPVLNARDIAYGGAIGIDRQFTPAVRLGLFAGGGSSKLRTEFNVQSVDSDYGFGGGYGRYDMRNYFVDFALFGGGISSNSTRLVANNLVASGLETATASYHGWFISPDVTVGYRFINGFGTLTPKARLRYVGGSLDGYSETGSAQGLTIGKRDISDIEERLGVEFAHTAQFGPGSVRARIELSAVALQRLGDNTINAVLLAQNLAFTTPGRGQAFGGVLSGGLEVRPTSNVNLYVSVEGMAMDDKSYSYVGKGGVRVGF